MKTWVLLGLMAVLGPAANMLMSAAMKTSGGPGDWTVAEMSHFFLSAMTQGMVWLGITSWISWLLCYLLVLSWADYSYISPTSAVSYAVVVLLGHLLLGEHVPPLRWLGVAVICSGVLLVGGTHAATGREH